MWLKSCSSEFWVCSGKGSVYNDCCKWCSNDNTEKDVAFACFSFNFNPSRLEPACALKYRRREMRPRAKEQAAVSHQPSLTPVDWGVVVRSTPWNSPCDDVSVSSSTVDFLRWGYHFYRVIMMVDVIYVCMHIMFRVHQPIMEWEGSINFFPLLLLHDRSTQRRTDTRQAHMRKSR